MARGLARARGRSDVVRAGRAGRGRRVAERTRPRGRSPSARAWRSWRAAGLSVTAAIPVADADAAVEPRRGAIGAARSRSSSMPRAWPTRATSGSSRLGLADDDAIRAAAARPARDRRAGTVSTSRGLLVEPMAAPGVELIVGLRRDPQFGPAVVVGLGGDLHRGPRRRRDPARAGRRHATALAMLDDLRGAAAPRRRPRRPAVDRAAVADLIVGLSRVWRASGPTSSRSTSTRSSPRPAGAVAVDALVVLEASDD